MAISSLLFTSGCIATRDWVNEQLSPVNNRVSDNEASINQVGGRVTGVEAQVSKMSTQITELQNQLSQTNAKADRALESLQRLKPERKMVLNFTGGAQFATNSIEFSGQAKKEIDGFLSDAKGESADGSSLLYVVAGHTDNTGSDSLNYNLSKRRAENIAAYLMTEKKIDPSRILTVGYGERTPVADNQTELGRAETGGSRFSFIRTTSWRRRRRCAARHALKSAWRGPKLITAEGLSECQSRLASQDRLLAARSDCSTAFILLCVIE